MNKNIISILIITTFLVVIGCSNGPSGPEELDSFAQCLTEKDVKMFGTEWCSHCKSQKALFGNSFQEVDYIDCDKNQQACANAGVTGYPTWQIEGQNYPGVQGLQKLASLSGCSLTP
jgi:glutaredoxin